MFVPATMIPDSVRIAMPRRQPHLVIHGVLRASCARSKKWKKCALPRREAVWRRRGARVPASVGGRVSGLPTNVTTAKNTTRRARTTAILLRGTLAGLLISARRSPHARRRDGNGVVANARRPTGVCNRTLRCEQLGVLQRRPEYPRSL